MIFLLLRNTRKRRMKQVIIIFLIICYSCAWLLFYFLFFSYIQIVLLFLREKKYTNGFEIMHVQKYSSWIIFRDYKKLSHLSMQFSQDFLLSNQIRSIISMDDLFVWFKFSWLKVEHFWKNNYDDLTFISKLSNHSKIQLVI